MPSQALGSGPGSCAHHAPAPGLTRASPGPPSAGARGPGVQARTGVGEGWDLPGKRNPARASRPGRRGLGRSTGLAQSQVRDAGPRGHRAWATRHQDGPQVWVLRGVWVWAAGQDAPGSGTCVPLGRRSPGRRVRFLRQPQQHPEALPPPSQESRARAESWSGPRPGRGGEGHLDPWTPAPSRILRSRQLQNRESVAKRRPCLHFAAASRDRASLPHPAPPE